MKTLTEAQVQTIRLKLNKCFTDSPDLQLEFIDHISCEVENLMQKNMDFNTALNEAFIKIFPKGTEEVEKEALDLQNKGMKKNVITSAYITFGFMTFSIICKLFHVPASNILIIISGILLIFYFLPLLFKQKYILEKNENKNAKKKYTYGYVGISIITIGIICKLFHIPATNLILIAGLIILNIVYLPIVFKKKN